MGPTCEDVCTLKGVDCERLVGEIHGDVLMRSDLPVEVFFLTSVYFEEGQNY